MTLRSKAQIILGAVLLAALLLLDVMFTGFLVDSADQTDRERMERNLSRTYLTLKGEERMLSAIAGNWAYSDKAWDFMTGANPDYPNIYMNRAVLTEIGVSSLIFLDNDGKAVFYRDYSSPDDESSPESEIEAFSGDGGTEFLRNIPEDGASGVIMKGGEPILFAVKRIRRSNKGGAEAGSLIATMALSPKMIQIISNSLDFTFAIVPVTPKEKEKELPGRRLDNAPSSSYIRGSALVRDYKGAPAFWITCVSPNVDIREAKRRLQMLFLALGAAAAAVVFLFGLFMKEQVTARLVRLRREIETVRGDGGDTYGVTVDKKRDEIAELQRTLNDSIAFFEFKQSEKNRVDDITLSVYKRFSEAGSRLCMKTLEDIATVFWREGDRASRSAVLRGAREARKFAAYLGMEEEELVYIYTGSLFAKMGMITLPHSLLYKKTPLSPAEEREYKKYPIRTKDLMNGVELLRPAASIAYSWNESWDGSGFPRRISGSSIPLGARIYAVVEEWNELTRPWPGRVLPDKDYVTAALRAKAGSRLDPHIVEKFIEYLHGGE